MDFTRKTVLQKSGGCQKAKEKFYMSAKIKIITLICESWLKMYQQNEKKLTINNQSW